MSEKSTEYERSAATGDLEDNELMDWNTNFYDIHFVFLYVCILSD